MIRLARRSCRRWLYLSPLTKLSLIIVAVFIADLVAAVIRRELLP
jgi:hypothetical protein